MAALKANADFGERPHRPRYEIIDKDGNVVATTTGEKLSFDCTAAAAEFARLNFPGQEQDEERSGKGWDIAVVGS